MALYLKKFLPASGLVIVMIMAGCSGNKPDSIGVQNNRLSACPGSPNCVASDAQDTEHRLEPFQLIGNSGTGWPNIVAAVTSTPRTTVISQTDNYLHAECRSRVFRFVDDLELLLDEENGIISIRSAARLGKSDFGVNRKRIESLRQALTEKGVIRP